MEYIKTFIDIFMHLDKHLSVIIQNYGLWTYAILFLIIFCETGLVVTPFLPGDSLLFAAGAFAGLGVLDVTLLCVLLSIAAILGDTVNYAAGHIVGPRVFSGEKSRFLNREHLVKTHAFYEKYGGKTIIIARFMPIIRTFAPFVAGIGSMNYSRFILFNITGGLLWIGVFIIGGYIFGNIPLVKKNFTLVIMVIIILSVMPGVIEYVRHRMREKS
ncbi:MAG: DedA family protein [Nitrospirae bacterium]|nr:DedA family protein [Nitrospirota bacterium]